MLDATTNTEKERIGEQLVDALSVIFGAHSGYRPVHAKGIEREGTFTAAPTATGLAAPHLQNQRSPPTVRFSDFSSIPSLFGR